MQQEAINSFLEGNGQEKKDVNTIMSQSPNRNHDNELRNENRKTILNEKANDGTTSATTNTGSTGNISEETIYEFYMKHMYPALVSSLPILLRRMTDDSKQFLLHCFSKFIAFIAPKWDTENYSSKTATYLKNIMNQNMTNPSSIVDYMLRNFDLNHDGHISTTELTEYMKQNWPHQLQIQQQQNNDNGEDQGTTMASYIFNQLLHNDLLHQHQTLLHRSRETWGTWFSREWPLMEWKIGVLLWRSFGGILLVLALLSIIPGRTHGISAKVLRWPVLGLTYFLVLVELMVYVVIRVFIRVAEYVIARPKHRRLRHKMSMSKSYDEWHSCASQLDQSQKRDVWLCQFNDHTSHRYNWGFVRELIKDMRKARSKKDYLFALAVIQQCTRKNVGGIMSEDLFSYSNTGEPKSIVTEFVNELCLTLRWVTDEACTLPVMMRDDDTATVMTQQESIRFEEDQQKYTKEYQKQVSNENNKLLQSLIHATLSLFIDTTGNTNVDNKPQTKNESKDDEHAQVNKNQNASKASTGNVKVDVCGNQISTKSGSTSDDSENNPANEESDNVSILKDLPSTIKYSSNVNEMISAVHRKEVVAFLLRAKQAYGRTALCLSGGAMMGLYHFGHVLGLLETGSLPDIISGTSGGSVVGAIICTRTDEELKHDLDPKVLIHYLKCFSRPWKERIKSVFQNGNLFSFEEWMEKIQWFTCGQTTFEEAYKKTGRIFCVTLSSTTKKAPPVLVNYLTAPNVTIASAVIASAAVPGFIAPVRLQYKDKHGVVRSQEGETFFDGSIEQDIPVNGLAEMLNCQFFIACQCNPHVVPFFYNSKGGVGRPSRWSSGTQEDSWRGGFLLAALEMYLKNDMKAKMRFLHDLEAAIGFTSTMMTQDFVGSTTIVPQVSFQDYFKLFSDPLIADLYRYFQHGTVAAYEHIAMIKLHYSVADTLDSCIQKLDVGKKNGSKNPRQYMRSTIVIPASKKYATDEVNSSSLFRTRLSAVPSTSIEEKGDSLSCHTESDEEDEFEREWVTGGVTKKLK